MTQEIKKALIITLGGIWLAFISAYGMITVGHFVILSMSAAIGSLMFLAGLFEVLNKNEKRD